MVDLRLWHTVEEEAQDIFGRMHGVWLANTPTRSSGEESAAKRARLGLSRHFAMEVSEGQEPEETEATEDTELGSAQGEADKELLGALFKTVRQRCLAARASIAASSVKLQTLQRGRVAKVEMMKMREAAKCFETVAPALKSLVLRIRLASFEEQKAVRRLQEACRVAVCKRRVHGLCIRRLQALLVGLEKKVEAQQLLSRLQMRRRMREHPESLLRVALKAVQLRRQLAERREHEAVSCIQARARGGFERAQQRTEKEQVAMQTVRDVCRRFAAQQSLRAVRQRQLLRDSSDLWRSVIQTYKKRSQLAFHLLYSRASAKITAMWRGALGRRAARKVRFEKSAQGACNTLRSFLRCYWARETLLGRRLDTDYAENQRTFCTALRTLKMRMRFCRSVDEARKRAAMEVLSRYVKGMYIRSGRVFDWEKYAKRTGRRITDDIRERMASDKAEVEWAIRVRKHVLRVRVELEDERLQVANMAALQLQRSWRARQVRLQHFMSRLALRLAAERQALLALQRSEVQAMHSMSSDSVQGALRPFHVQVMCARPYPPRDWVASLSEAPEPVVDVDAADSFAILAGRSGTAYCLPSHANAELIGSPEPLKLKGPFVLQHHRLLAASPSVVQVSCGAHHALLMTGDGLCFAWGKNDCGQCGIGWPRPEQLEQRVVAEATCLQPWAATHGVATSEMRSAGLLEPQRGESLTAACASGAVLPRLRSVSAGPQTNLALDCDGQAWAWGSRTGLGLNPWMPLAQPRAAPSKGTVRPGADGSRHPTACPFLLFQVIKATETGASRSSKSVELQELDLKELPGNVLVPTLLCNLTPLEGEGSARSVSSALPEAVILHSKGGKPQAILTPAAGAGAGAGGGRSENFFVSAVDTEHASFAVTARGVAYSWAAQGGDILGRSGASNAPAAIPTFVQLSICVTCISAAVDHALALTAHGRVFTWGTLEASVGTERFQRRSFTQPMCVEGAVRGLKVSKVLAGRTSSLVAFQDCETVLGWDMVEVSMLKGKGHVDPAVYEFSLTYDAFGGTDPGSADSPKFFEKVLSPARRPPSAICSPTSPKSPRTPASPTSPVSPTSPTSPYRSGPGRSKVTAKLSLCQSQTLQLLMQEPPKGHGPFSHSELFAWAGRRSAAAHARREDDEEAFRQQSMREMRAERSRIKQLSNVSLLREVARPRTFVEFDREISMYRRLSNPPEELRRTLLENRLVWESAGLKIQQNLSTNYIPPVNSTGRRICLSDCQTAAMFRSLICCANAKHLKPRIKGGIMPFYQRIRQEETARRYRQLPFLSVSKEPSKWPAPPDPRDVDRRLCKLDLAREMNIKVGDRVRVLYGSEKGKHGVISRIIRDKNQVIVSGVSLKRSFWHPDPGPGKPSIVSVECPIHITNVVLVDPVTKQPTRVKRRYMMNGEGVRISKVSGCAMPEPVAVGLNEREVLWKQHEEGVLRQTKERRGPPKEDIFGNKEHFKTLVRLVRERRAAEDAQGKAVSRTSVE
ncbi:rplX [Symbiodinium sp. KB8]|nr:rplX [Symbiodinium sp. KB8]